MKIGINLTYIGKDINDGISNHAKDIIDGLNKIGKSKDFILITDKRFYENARIHFPQFEVIEAEKSKLIEILTKISNRFSILQRCYIALIGLNKTIKKHKIDVILHTFNDKKTRLVKGIPNIIVIHDLYFKNFSHMINPLFYYITKYSHNQFVQKSDAIVVISGFVKKDLLSYYKFVDESKIHVIPNAVSINENKNDGNNRLPCEKPYILCVNNHQFHKNGITLLKAFDIIKNEIPHNLIFLGKIRYEAPNLLEYIKEHNLSSRVYLIDSLSETDKNNLYRNADLFVSPSLHEGFGRTPIEASMFKIPVITSRETSLAETTMELVNYYEPARDARALAEAIIKVLKNSPSEEELRRIKSIYENKYKAELIAQKYYDLCVSFIGKNRREQLI
ncbi:MAG TPA: glycosyltransferase family 4 protein [Tissierellia bacterium]|nr:glycosyltransferase family 4 protein [Tissierellia bacterium]